MSIQLWSPPEDEETPEATKIQDKPPTFKKGPLIFLALGLMILGICCFSLGTWLGWRVRGSNYVETLLALKSSKFLRNRNLSLEDLDRILNAVDKEAVKTIKPPQPIPAAQAKNITQDVASIPQQPYTIQLGIFASKDNAEDLMNHLVSQGVACQIFEVQDNAQVLFSVRVGNYSNFYTAQEAMETLVAQHNISAALIPLPIPEKAS